MYKVRKHIRPISQNPKYIKIARSHDCNAKLMQQIKSMTVKYLENVFICVECRIKTYVDSKAELPYIRVLFVHQYIWEIKSFLIV